MERTQLSKNRSNNLNGVIIVELNRRKKRQIQILEHLYKFDLDKGVVEVPLHYKFANDMLDEILSRPENPVISKETNEYIWNTISDVPEGFSVSLQLTVDDYGEYSPKLLMEAMKNSMENNYYIFDGLEKENIIFAMLFVIVGITIILFRVVGNQQGWFSLLGIEGTYKIIQDVIMEITSIVSWAFVWQSAIILFLTYDSENARFKRAICSIDSICFVNSDKQILCDAKERELYNNWEINSKSVKFANAFILISNTIMLLLGIALIFKVLTEYSAFHQVQLICLGINGVVVILMSVCNLSFCCGKGIFRHFAIYCSILYVIIAICNYIACAIAGTPFSRNINIDIGILILSVLINIILMIILKTQQQKEEII